MNTRPATQTEMIDEAGFRQAISMKVTVELRHTRETMAFGKVIHQKVASGLPRIADGKVFIRHAGKLIEITAERHMSCSSVILSWREV
jgi:hypothetical protein